MCKHLSVGKKWISLIILGFALVGFRSPLSAQVAVSPSEAPIGLFGIWSSAQWQKAWDLNLVDSEFENINDTESTFLHRGISNEHWHIREYEGLNGGTADLTISIAAERMPVPLDVHSDFTNSDYDNTSPKYYVPDFFNWRVNYLDTSNGQYGLPWISFFDIVDFYAFSTDFDLDDMTDDNNTFRDDAHNILSELVDDIYQRYSLYNGFSMWYVDSESWRTHRTVDDNNECGELISYAISEIRERDTQKPILMLNAYQLAKQGAIYDGFDPIDIYGGHTYNDRYVIDRVFDGSLGGGWNIYVDERYPFRYKDVYDDDLHLYDPNGDGICDFNTYYGQDYYYNFYWEWRYADMLNHDIENYELATGIEAEWWMHTQGQRELVYKQENQQDPDEVTSVKFTLRRPTMNEYQMQYYLYLAAGAKGLITYKTTSERFPTIGLPPPIINEDVAMNDRIYMHEINDNGGLRLNYYGIPSAHGYISDSWIKANDPTTNFRTPISFTVDYDDAEFDFNTLDFNEPYSRIDSYPYDYMAEANGLATSLLPIMRPLRWNASFDGIDISYWHTHTDDNPGDGDATRPYWHPSIADSMDGNATLADKFGLRGVRDEEEYYWETWNDNYERRSSNIIVGCFDDPKGDPTAEYYLVLNMRCNQESQGTIIDAIYNSSYDEFKLDFEGTPGSFCYGVVWYNHGTPPYEDDLQNWAGPTSGGDFDEYLTIGLHPGSAVLIKRVPLNSVYTGPSTITTNTWWGSTPRVINSDLHVQAQLTIGTKIQLNNGADILVESGGTLRCIDSALLEFDGGGIEVSGTGMLRFDPTDDYVVCRAVDETGWQGITLDRDTPADPRNLIKKTLISGATIGVKLMDWEYLPDPPVYSTELLEDVEIYDCTTGVQAVRDVKISDSHIHDCETGVELLQNSSFTCEISSTIIENNSINGIDDDRFNKLTLRDLVTVRGNGIYGIYVNNALIDFEEVEIYNNGDSWSWGYPGLVLTNSTSVSGKFKEMKIVENYGPGILLNESSINTTVVNGVGHTIANNGLFSREQSGFAYGSEITLTPPCGLDLTYRHANIFHNWNPEITNYALPDDELALLWNTSQTVKDIQGIGKVWWGDVSGDVIDSVAEFRDHLHGPNGPSSFTVSAGMQFANSPFDSETYDVKYWGTNPADADEVQLVIQQAYADLDAGNVQQAYDAFWNLIQDEEIDALQGFIRAGLRLEQTPGQISTSLAGLSIEDPYFAHQVERAIANSFTLGYQFDEARIEWDTLIDEADTEHDSLNAEIGWEGVNITELKLQRAGALPDSGRTVQSLPMLDKQIAEAEERVLNLYAQLYGAGDAARVAAASIPTEFALHPAYPNPFNPSVTIPFALPKAADTKIAIYNTLGQRVAVVVDKTLQAGQHSVVWQGVSSSGQPVSSGVYFVQMQAPGFIKTQKIVMLK
ncbi:T9SS type A sorting domain-containing protein [bacterium]|nr:T9SS type A sorting domain-containing protein [bacterium]